jgi:hypothetical protein
MVLSKNYRKSECIISRSTNTLLAAGIVAGSLVASGCSAGTPKGNNTKNSKRGQSDTDDDVINRDERAFSAGNGRVSLTTEVYSDGTA